MKRRIFTTAAALILAALCFALAACGPRDELFWLERELSGAHEVYDNLDNISNEDLSGGMFNNMSYSGAMQPMSLTAAGNPPGTVIEKIQQAVALQSELREKQAAVDQNKLLISAGIADLKANIKNFRELGLKLAEDEKSLITNYIEELKGIREELKGTIGNVYLKIFMLRGKFNVANLDNIIQTYTEVQPHMDVRVECSARTVEIINDINSLLSDRIGNENQDGSGSEQRRKGGNFQKLRSRAEIKT